MAAVVAAVPVGAQPTCVLGGAAEYNALGAVGCEWGGLTFSNFDVDVGPNPIIVPSMLHGLTTLQMGIFTPALTATQAGAVPGTPFSDVSIAEMSFDVSGVSAAWLVLDPFSLQVQDVISQGPWTAATLAYLRYGGHFLWVGKSTDGGPVVPTCALDYAPIACDIASTRILYTGGRITAGAWATVAIPVAPDFNTAFADSGGLYFGFAAVPEPSTLLLSGSGLMALAMATRRRRAIGTRS